MTCVIDQNSIDAIVLAVWQKLLDTAFSAEEMMKVDSAVLSGKVSGAESNIVIFRNITDTKNTVTADVDSEGNRISIALDVL